MPWQLLCIVKCFQEGRSPGASPGSPPALRARVPDQTGELIAEIPTGTDMLFRDVVVAFNVDVSRSEARVAAALDPGHRSDVRTGMKRPLH